MRISRYAVNVMSDSDIKKILDCLTVDQSSIVAGNVLYTVCSKCPIDIVAELLSQRQYNVIELTDALNISLREKQYHTAKLLLEYGAEPHINGIYQMVEICDLTAIQLLCTYLAIDNKKIMLEFAASLDRLAIVRYILEQESGIDINFVDSIPAYFNIEKIIERYNSSDIPGCWEKTKTNHIYHKQSTILSISAQKGHYLLTKYLLDSGTDLHVASDLAVREAVYHGQYIILKLFYETDPHIDFYAHPYLTLCLSYIGEEDKQKESTKHYNLTLQFLLDHIVCSHFSPDKAKAIKWAIRMNQIDMVKLLLQHGTESFTDVFLTSDIATYSNLAMMQLILDAGADEYDLSSALSIAIVENKFDMARLLMTYGAHIDNQLISVIYCVIYDQLDMTQHLLQEINQYSNFNELLIMACHFGRFQIVKLLLTYETDITINNQNVLFVAIINGYSEIAELLIAHGADIQIFHACSDIIKERIANYKIRYTNHHVQYFLAEHEKNTLTLDLSLKNHTTALPQWNGIRALLSTHEIDAEIVDLICGKN